MAPLGGDRAPEIVVSEAPASENLVRRGDHVVLPGFVNAHSHAFHRALRSVSEGASGDFWTWRRLMYQVAERLDPDSYRELATCVYGEMVLSGWSAVGEFHYLHHGPGGVAYDDPNEMTWSLLEAAETAGIRITLLDTCYLQASVSGDPLEGVQRRFSDRSGDEWSRRLTQAAASGRFGPTARLGAAIHSVRAVPPPAMASVAAFSASEGAPLHVHVSEQRQENEQCLAALSMTPTDLLASTGVLTERTTAVHATHLSTTDVTRYGLGRCGICACPTTEADLGDGVGAFAELAEAGAVLSIGSDSHAALDPFLEARSLEWNLRLREERRGVLSPAALLEAATAGGSRSLGIDPDSGDTVEVNLSSAPAIATAEDTDLIARVLFSATPRDVASVTVAGRRVVEGGVHDRLGDPPAVATRLSRAIGRVLS